MKFLGLPASDLPFAELACRGFLALPAQLHFAVQRTPLTRLHLRQRVKAAFRLVSAHITIRVFAGDDTDFSVLKIRNGIQQRAPQINLGDLLRIF